MSDSVTTTRTHTIYFSVDDLMEIEAGIQRLETSFIEREDWISEQVSAAIDRRLAILRQAWELLLEPVPGSLS